MHDNAYGLSYIYNHICHHASRVLRLLLNSTDLQPGGASSEAWNRLLMIAPVKKFDRARLSTDFLINKHGGDFM